MRISRVLIICTCFIVWFAASASAIPFEMADGRVVEGEIIQGKPEALQIRVGDGEYQKLPWDKLSQKTLRMLAEDSKLKLETFVEPYIEIPDDERIKKTEVEIKGVPRLDRPEKKSLIGALLGSSVGMFMLILIYAANIYAGYEVAAVRAFPPAMVCGLSAVAPIIAPIVFLCMPTRLESGKNVEEDGAQAHAPTPPAFNPMAADPTGESHAGAGGQPAAGGLHIAHAPAAGASSVHKTEIFKRGQYTFNRRFIETKFSGFFGVVRRSDTKDMVLWLKTVRGEFTAVRISRIATADMHIEARKGEATQEIAIPFGEIQEIHLKHQDT